MVLTLLKGWKEVKEKFSLTNDQGMRFLCNLQSPSGKIVTLFEVKGKIDTIMVAFDKMIKDYSITTENLSLVTSMDFKCLEKKIPVYIIHEKISNNYICQLFFNKNDILYSMVFNLQEYEENFKLNENNKNLLREVCSLVEVQ